jgi:hypothetical protein
MKNRWRVKMGNATVTTIERFEANVTSAELDEEVRLRIKAAAIRSSYEKDNVSGGWVLKTEWNVVGEQ